MALASQMRRSDLRYFFLIRSLKSLDKLPLRILWSFAISLCLRPLSRMATASKISKALSVDLEVF